MESEPQTFSWPGLPVASDSVQTQPVSSSVEPAQAAADAAAAGHQQGFDRGYAEGFAKGELDASAQAQQKLSGIEAIFIEAEAFAAQWRSAQVELVQLISAKFLLQELISDTDRLVKVLAQGQQLLPSSEDFSLACHPDLESALDKHSHYNLVVDAQLPPGSLELRQGCSCLQLDIDALVAQAFSNLDQTLETQATPELEPLALAPDS